MKNHYVPEFYFEPWLNPQRHLYQFGWRRGRLIADLKSPGQICYRRDLHTLNDAIRTENRDAIEEWLTKAVDSKAAPVIKKIIHTGIQSINTEEGSDLVRFILSLIVRRPENVDRLIQEAPEEFMRNIAAQESSVKKELEEAGIDPVTMLEYANSRHPGLIENAGQLLICQIVADKSWGEKLFHRTWWTMDFTGTSVAPQITSDRALTCLGTGLADPNSLVILPLSPSLVLYASNDEHRQRLQGIGKGQLGLETIRAVTATARTFAYGAIETNQNLIEKNLPQP